MHRSRHALAFSLTTAIVFSLLGVTPTTGRQAPTQSEPPPADAPKPAVEDPDAKVAAPLRELAQEAASYLIALDKAAVCEGTRGDLGLRLRIYPDALEHELVRALLSGLRAGKSLDECAQQIAANEKELRRLKEKPGFALELLHPQYPAEKRAETPEQVHILAGDLSRSIVFRVDDRTLEWSAWRQPEKLVYTIVQLARHYTVRHRERVAVVKPLQPEGPRSVFRGRSARVWGILPTAIVTRKRGQLSVVLEKFGEFNGVYNDAHILDLNDQQNSFDPEQPELRVSTQLPFYFPTKSPTLTAALERLFPSGK
ncbi:MAG: hypothetical protein ACKVX7_10055 [Planctomycetota bacterium]